MSITNLFTFLVDNLLLALFSYLTIFYYTTYKVFIFSTEFSVDIKIVAQKSRLFLASTKKSCFNDEVTRVRSRCRFNSLWGERISLFQPRSTFLLCSISSSFISHAFRSISFDSQRFSELPDGFTTDLMLLSVLRVEINSSESGQVTRETRTHSTEWKSKIKKRNHALSRVLRPRNRWSIRSIKHFSQ